MEFLVKGSSKQNYAIPLEKFIFCLGKGVINKKRVTVIDSLHEPVMLVNSVSSSEHSEQVSAILPLLQAREVL